MSCESQTHTVICLDALELRPNKFKHLGAEIEAGDHLKGKDWRYYAGHIKAIIVPYVIRKDFSKSPPEMTAAIKILKADALEFVKAVAKCEVHPEDWDVRFRSTDVLDNRCWIEPAQTWACRTLVHKKED